MGDKIIKFDKITKFNSVKIHPEEYKIHRHSAARVAERDLSLILYYSTFKYKGQTGYMYKLFTKEFLELTNPDPITIMKNECLRWAQSNYGEGGSNESK